MKKGVKYVFPGVIACNKEHLKVEDLEENPQLSMR